MSRRQAPNLRPPARRLRTTHCAQLPIRHASPLCATLGRSLAERDNHMARGRGGWSRMRLPRPAFSLSMCDSMLRFAWVFRPWTERYSSRRSFVLMERRQSLVDASHPLSRHNGDDVLGSVRFDAVESKAGGSDSLDGPLIQATATGHALP